MQTDTQEQSDGLSAKEAAARLARHGPNELGVEDSKRFWQTIIEILTEPLLILLVAAAVIYAAVGDIAEGLLLCGFAVLSISLLVYQARRSENALAALKALAAPVATVIRDGVRMRIAAREVVPGDLVAIDEGERIPADGVLIRAQALIVDESLLTGESVPVRKKADPGAIGPGKTDVAARHDVPGGDDQPQVFAGTLGVSGHGLAVITETGRHTRTGSIGASLGSIRIEPTRLQQTTGRIVRLFGGAAFVVCLTLVAWIGLLEGDWVKGALSGIALAMAMLPEEFPVALAVFLAIGAWRLSQAKVLARRPAVVETLGAASVLCVDKTGTLTENRMRVAVLAVGDRELEGSPLTASLPSGFSDLVETAYLAARHASFDPMDSAVGLLAEATVQQALRGYGDWPLVREYGITPELLAFSQAWRDDAGVLRVATKGAPEAIAQLCGMSEDRQDAMLKQVGQMAARGLRVLGVAQAHHRDIEPLANPRDYCFTFVGLIGFEDPMRSTVPGAVALAHRGGLSVKMITGDYPETAMAIAARAGIDVSGGCLTGKAVAELNAAELRRAVADKNVFARMMPEQKLRLVGALKDNGEIVAMTGDGVNDAPALKSAHIGIAMGERGTDVAREAAGIVLLNEDFGTIVKAVRMGRRIFENLRKVMIYIAAIHVPIAGLALLPLLFGLPPLLLPMHVVLIEMIIDPMCSIAFETTPEETDIMEHPPRAESDPMVGAAQLLLGLLQGAVLLAVCFGFYWQVLSAGWEKDLARTLSVIVLTTANVGLARVNASRNLVAGHMFARGFRLFWLIALVAAAVIALCIAVPQMRALFGFAVPHAWQVVMAIGVGILAAAIPDLFKLIPGTRRIMGEVVASASSRPLAR